MSNDLTYNETHTTTKRKKKKKKEIEKFLLSICKHKLQTPNFTKKGERTPRQKMGKYGPRKKNKKKREREGSKKT